MSYRNVYYKQNKPKMTDNNTYIDSLLLLPLLLKANKIITIAYTNYYMDSVRLCIGEIYACYQLQPPDHCPIIHNSPVQENPVQSFEYGDGCFARHCIADVEIDRCNKLNLPRKKTLQQRCDAHPPDSTEVDDIYWSCRSI